MFVRECECVLYLVVSVCFDLWERKCEEEDDIGARKRKRKIQVGAIGLGHLLSCTSEP